MRKKGKRIVRNPKTGEEVPISPPPRHGVQAFRHPQAADQCQAQISSSD
jgi:nucleoid DNA-binding protein